ncbi:hypothetical protein SAMN05518801_10779 [Novosphingobium sp. CF614]|uniref:hypothetical protein n=1 Tax=Novosphingobium sp. CF614 TaxID=1884364 RepID=UPI0008E5EC79|nr:hypothetical protein [Novosphingobium sp. CF614]SFG09219.1 hypothetical protein SAMN05518801_10779 [Novosphingobium sp. CF614]
MDDAAAFRLARQIAESDPVLSVYAACEWDELNEDGQRWVAEIVRQAFALAMGGDRHG